MPTNAELMKRLIAVECRDSTYRPQSSPLVIDRGQGSLVFDVEGRAYTDLCAGFGVLALGHNPPVTKEILGNAQQLLMHGMGDVYPSRAKIQLLERLVSMMPATLKVAALALSGAQAVEMAVKTALLKTRRTGFIVFDGGYHGVDLGILPLTARDDFKEPFRGWLREKNVSSLPFGAGGPALTAAAAELTRNGHGVAAVLVEPVQGRAGVRLPPAGWLASLRRFCDEHGALLIYDEVFTGLGRTGRITHAEEVPCDLLCLGKALGGGLPLSACVGTTDAMEGWPESRGEALHTGTFFGHPLACALAEATLAAIVSEKLPARARDVGGAWVKDLREALAGIGSVKDVRGVGLMLAVEFKQAGAGAKAMDLLRERGVVALASGANGEAISFTPALNIPQTLLTEASANLVEVARHLTSS